MKHDYTSLDTAILKRIEETKGARFCDITQSSISGDIVMRHAEELENHPDEDAPAWRIVDRRLQALRRAGKIRHTGQKTGWVLE